MLGLEIRTADVEELRYEILKPLTDRYAAAQGIAVSEDEKRAYVESVRAGLAADRERQKARRDEVARRLTTPDLPASERASLEKELAEADGFLAALGEPETPSAEDQAAREEIASAFIRQWKIHQALWRQYGGRIGYQQGGPEPLDAVRKFLEERQAAGDFKIVDRDLETAFWRYYRDDSIHSFYAPGSREEAEAFAAPPWQRRDDRSRAEGGSDMATNDAAAKPGWLRDLEAAYGAPSQAAFGSAVFFEPHAEGALEAAAKRYYRTFVGASWETRGEAVWMGPWKEAYRRPAGAPHDVVTELGALTAYPTRMQADLLLNPPEGAAAARQALAAAFDPPETVELAAWNLGDGEAMSGLLLAGRRQDGGAVFLVLLMD